MSQEDKSIRDYLLALDKDIFIALNIKIVQKPL